MDFWPNFEPENFLFTKVLKSLNSAIQIEIVHNPTLPVDLEIRSVFTFSSLQEKLFVRSKATISQNLLNDYVNRANFGYRSQYLTPAKKRLWYTGENLRPPQGIFDGTISFDRTDQKANNLFFPFLYLGIDWYGQSKDRELSVTPESLTQRRKIRGDQELKACSFATNKVSERQRLVKITNIFFEVEEYGRSVNRFVSSKSRVAEKFVFQICNENSYYPGYVTEKLLESWKIGNIAIWSGGTVSDIPLNPNSYVDCSLLTESEIEKKLSLLDQDKIAEMLSAPFMNLAPSITPLEEYFRETIG